MRVLFVSPAAQLGGAERCLLDCLVALRIADPHAGVRVLALANGPLLQRVRALGTTTQVIEPPPALAQLGESGGEGLGALLGAASSLPPTLRFLRKLRAAIAKAKPDVIHTNGMKAHLLAGATAPLHARLVVHLHDFIGARRASRWLLPALARLRERTVFMANSHAVATDFARLAPRAHVRTVYNVVDIDYFRPAAAEPEWLSGLAGLDPPSPNAVCFGLVATYARWKGHELFIEAAGRLRAAHPSVPLRFYVVGGPIYETRGSQVEAQDLLRWAQAARMGDCFGVVPFQEDIARVYRALNVVVHASTEPEPFGRTIVEAMACAKPVVVANAGGAAELFQHGKNAVGYQLGSVSALAASMAILLDERFRRRVGDTAREHAVDQFGSARLPAQLLAAYTAKSP